MNESVNESAGLTEVWSGGQTGADIAGLRAAQATGLPTGGWMPKGWRTESGPRPRYRAQFGMRETESREYPPRTLANVDETDGTIILGDRPDSMGCALTIRYCTKFGKPFRVLTTDDLCEPDSLATTASWIEKTGIRRLNVAGNRDAPEGELEAWLRCLFRLVRREGFPGDSKVC